MNPALDPNITDTFSSPLAEESAKRILNKTILEGITIYSNEIDPLHPNSGGLIPLQTYGVPMALSNLKHDNLTRTFRNKDGMAYEFILRNSDLDRNYTIAVRANSSLVNEQVREYLIHSIVILLLVAAFITTILMKLSAAGY